MPTLAIVTSDPAFRAHLDGDFEVTYVPPEVGLDPAYAVLPDAYVVDANHLERFELVAHLSTLARRPVLVVGASITPEDVSEYLDAGADAVVCSRELDAEGAARVRALVRRAGNGVSREPAYRAGHVLIFPESRRVLLGDHEVRLTRTEFNLLATLAEHLDEVVPHRKLMAHVWGPEYLSARHYLRVYVRRVREKIERDPESPTLLVAERGRGYMLCSTPVQQAAVVA